MCDVNWIHLVLDFVQYTRQINFSLHKIRGILDSEINVIV